MFGRSGRAVELLTDWQIGDALMRIVAQAQQRLTLVSPYNKHWGHLKREVAAAQGRGVPVTIYYRADESSPMAEYDGVTAIPVRMLHAKIYANETTALVSTMNLLETSAMYSRDVGLLLRDPKLRHEIDEYVKSLANDAAAEPLAWGGGATRNGAAARQQVRTASDIARVIETSGFCIECGTAKDFDLDKPLCISCYTRYGRNGTHKLCHRCGEPHPAQLNQPLCPACQDARQPVGV